MSGRGDRHCIMSPARNAEPSPKRAGVGRIAGRVATASGDKSNT